MLILLLLLVQPISAIVVINGPSWGTRQEFGHGLTKKEWKIGLKPGNQEFLITQKNIPHSSLDLFAITADGKIIRPKTAKQKGVDVTYRVRGAEKIVTDIHENPVVLTFDVPQAKVYKLQIIANEYDDKSLPLRSPKIGYAIAKVNDGTMEIDGKLDKGLGTYSNPIWWVLANGRPQGYTYSWFRTDGKYLYAAIEVAGDNTNVENERISLIVKMPESGFEKFTIDAKNKEYGRAGFQMTDKAGWDHKVFEFKIPYPGKPRTITYTIEYQLN